MQFECNFCDKDEKALKEPLNSYVDYSWLLDCTFCGKEFKQNEDLIIHIG